MLDRFLVARMAPLVQAGDRPPICPLPGVTKPARAIAPCNQRPVRLTLQTEAGKIARPFQGYVAQLVRAQHS